MSKLPIMVTAGVMTAWMWSSEKSNFDFGLIHILLTFILFVGFLVICFSIIDAIFDFIKNLYYAFSKNSKFNKMEKKRREMLDSGGSHKWVDLPIIIGGPKVKVCLKTGYCPSKDGYYDIEQINQIYQATLIGVEREKRFDEYKKEKFVEIAQQYDLTEDHVSRIAETLWAMKKDFAVRELEAVSKEFKDKFPQLNLDKK